MSIRAPAGLFLFAIGAGPLCADDELIVHYSATARFADVVEDATNAIAERGLVVDHISNVGTMLDRTGKDLGAARTLFHPEEAKVFSMCSAVLSRRAMEADPLNIVFCPYTLALYSTPQQPGTVHIAYRRIRRTDDSAQSDAALRDVERLLDDIAREALHLPAN